MTIIKLLYRCLLGYRSIQKCWKIFSLVEKRRKLFLNVNRLIGALKSLPYEEGISERRTLDLET